jgi:hypothetical protein
MKDFQLLKTNKRFYAFIFFFLLFTINKTLILATRASKKNKCNLFFINRTSCTIKKKENSYFKIANFADDIVIKFIFK